MKGRGRTKSRMSMQGNAIPANHPNKQRSIAPARPHSRAQRTIALHLAAHHSIAYYCREPGLGAVTPGPSEPGSSADHPNKQHSTRP